MSGGTETTTNTEQTRTPWAPAANIIENTVLPGLRNWGSSPMEYTGPSYIDPTMDWGAALEGMRGAAGGAGAGVVDPTMQAWQRMLDPSSFMTAPGAVAPLDWYAQQVGRNLDENIRPGYAMEQIAAGQYGGLSGTRAQNERLAERQANEAIAQFGSQLTGSLYNQGLNASMGAMSMAPQMYATQMMPYETLMGLDQMTRGEGYQQQQMEGAAQDFAQREQFNRMQQLFGILGPAGNLGGTMIGTQTQEQDMGFGNYVAPLVGMGMGAMMPQSMGGAGLWSRMFPAGAAATPTVPAPQLYPQVVQPQTGWY